MAVGLSARPTDGCRFRQCGGSCEVLEEVQCIQAAESLSCKRRGLGGDSETRFLGVRDEGCPKCKGILPDLSLPDSWRSQSPLKDVWINSLVSQACEVVLCRKLRAASEGRWTKTKN